MLLSFHKIDKCHVLINVLKQKSKMALDRPVIPEYNIHNDVAVLFFYKMNGVYTVNTHPFAVSTTNGELVCQFIKSSWFNEVFEPQGDENVTVEFMVVGVNSGVPLDTIEEYVRHEEYHRLRFHYSFSVSHRVLRETSDSIAFPFQNEVSKLVLRSTDEENVSMTFKARLTRRAIDNIADHGEPGENQQGSVVLSNPCVIIPKDLF